MAKIKLKKLENKLIFRYAKKQTDVAHEINEIEGRGEFVICYISNLTSTKRSFGKNQVYYFPIVQTARQYRVRLNNNFPITQTAKKY